MAITYTLIETKTLASSTAVVTFSTIPSTYTDLLVKGSTRQSGNSEGSQLGIRFNGSSASEYSRVLLFGFGNGVQTAGGSSETYARTAFAQSSTYTANNFGNFEICIANYTSSLFKSFTSDAVNETSATSYVYSLALYAGLWSNTATITSLSLSDYPGSTDFAANSTFYLYGIKNS
jgi:hypothetical protein